MSAATPTLFDIRLVDGPVTWTALAPYPAEAGGESVFLGRTRIEHHPEHGALVRLSYEAHESMAHRELERLALEATDRFGCLAVRVLHAVGHVPPGDASVLVQVACGHRAQSFEACRFLIDELKAQVPIWKREEWADGSTWSEGTPVDAGAGAAASDPE